MDLNISYGNYFYATQSKGGKIPPKKVEPKTPEEKNLEKMDSIYQANKHLLKPTKNTSDKLYF